MSLQLSLIVFLTAAAVVVLAGTRLAAYGDYLAEKTGLGRLFVGTITLALIDLRYRGRVWPAVEVGHSQVAAVAVVLAALAALGLHTPSELAVGWVGLVSILIFVLYLAAVAWFRRYPTMGRRSAYQDDPPPLLQPTSSRTDLSGMSVRDLLISFVVGALSILVAAPAMTLRAERIAFLTGIAETSIGVLLLAVTTSLPELSASLAAEKIGSHDLAVGNLFGSTRPTWR